MNAPDLLPEDEDLPVRPGDVMGAKYRVERVLGRGAIGVVVEARRIDLDEHVAIKILHTEYAKSARTSVRFLREAQAAGKIEGEHAARVSDVGTLEGGAPYAVMELLSGLDLSEALERHGVFQISDAVDHVLQACEAIAEAHKLGIVHGDVRPANLFLAQRADGTLTIKVLDFGIANGLGTGVLTEAAETLGSAPYLSPEQLREESEIDHRSDIYSLGVTLYELLAGRPPFYAGTLDQLRAEVLGGKPTPIRQLRADVPRVLAGTLERAYAREPAHRHVSVAAFAASLAPFATPGAQVSLDRIAQMAGLAPASAGSGGAAHSDLPPTPMGLMPGAPAAPLYSVPVEIPILDYQAPMSRKAAAAFAAGATPVPDRPRLGGRLGGSSGMLAIVAAIAIGTGLLLGGAAYFLLRGHDQPSTIDPPDPSVSILAPVTASHAPIADPSASGGPGATPASTGAPDEPAAP